MIKKVIKDIFSAINDHNREFSERVFLIFTIISEIVVLVAFAVNILINENIKELIVIGATLLLVPAVSITCLYKNRLKNAVRIIVTGLILLVIPGLFFFGGGVEGGGVLWIIFVFLYVGIMINGIWRAISLVLITLLTGACFLVQYYYPEYVTPHSREMFFIDSFSSIILLGLICFFITWFQTRLFKQENDRAGKEAERAEELTRSQNRFFSSMSHEIRTPINSILGLNELILRDESASDEIIKDALGIQGSGKMLLALINDILDFSKIEAGSMDIIPVDYRVGDMLSDIVNMIWLRAHDKGLEFNVSVDPEVPSVLYGDEVRIKQVIINLLNNAVKYTSEGSVELHIESGYISDDTVELSISVADTGIGIKKESLPFLFDAFKRVDEKKNRYIEGTGLGLSIVKQIVSLMDGTVSVNSVYGEGSVFTVVVRQEVSDRAAIGELNIHNEQTIKRSSYEAGFTAPEAKILIVDDNEMNIEVESKLLSATGMDIDKALSGREALGMTVKKRYDTILMDHLMPEMDGIECLEHIRNQSGGLNRTTPVIVLTANAGSDNRDLYNRSGFDGYLVKPVSGEALEKKLIRHIPSDKLIINSKMVRMSEDINASAGYSGKASVIITASSVCDLPRNVIKKLNIPIIPMVIRTENGIFKDGIQMDADELIRYMDNGGNAMSSSMDESEYTDFFANALRRAHNLIHISLTSSMSSDFKMATEAAKSFDNVTVINSGCLSSATGLLVLIAHKLAQQNLSVSEIISELEGVKKRIHCSFVVDTTEYMARKGFISPLMHKVAKSFYLHPALSFRDDRFSIGGLWIGSSRRAYRNYIHKAFPVDIIPDPDIVFITYVDIPIDTLLWIKEEISKIAYFENVVFQQASAAISSNCGSGTFGILYFAKGNKSYSLSNYIDTETEVTVDNEDDPSIGDSPKFSMEALEEKYMADTVRGDDEDKWYSDIKGIDAAAALKNCADEETFKNILKMFYDNMDANRSALDGFIAAQDYPNYTIKIHALKSSARLIGAVELGEEAALLEEAGKEKNTAYIKEHHKACMEHYESYRSILAEVINKNGLAKEEADKTLIDPDELKELYSKLKTAVREFDSVEIDAIVEKISGYSLPEDEAKRFKAICERADDYDYDGILTALEGET